jgi:membrane-associated phospholipid phosphatase
MRRLLFLIVVAILWGSLTQAQPVYSRQSDKVLAISLPGLGMSGLSMYLKGKNEPFLPEDVYELDVMDVPKIDRWVTRQYNLTAKRNSDITLFTSYVLPFTMLLGEESRRDFGSVGLITLEGLILNNGLTSLTKNIVRRPRPYLYNTNVPMELKITKGARESFFSGHTSNTAVVSFMTATFFSDYYGDSDMKPLVWGLAAAIPAYTGIQRMRAGKHYLTDVLVGYAVGAAVGVLVPRFHRL